MQYFQKKAEVMVQEFQAFWKQSKFQPKTYIHKKRAWMKIAQSSLIPKMIKNILSSSF